MCPWAVSVAPRGACVQWCRVAIWGPVSGSGSCAVHTEIGLCFDNSCEGRKNDMCFQNSTDFCKTQGLSKKLENFATVSEIVLKTLVCFAENS